MYSVKVSVTGVSPLMQHRFPLPDLEALSKGGSLKSGEPDYSQEWRKAMYVDSNGCLYQPAAHFEGAMIKAAASYKIKGARGKTYKDLFRSSVIVSPDEIPFNMPAPQELDGDPDKVMYLDVRPVVIQRARIARIRPTFKAGWHLEFEIMVSDGQIPKNVLYEVLSLAGKTVGVGDYRPRFGRFQIAHFEEV